MGNRGSRHRRPRLKKIRIGIGFEFEFHCKQATMCLSSENPGTNILLVVGFSSASSSSGACQDMEPIFNEFAEKYKDVHFIKMDVDEKADAVEQYGIQTTPTFVLIKDGEEVDRLVGDDREELERKIEKHHKVWMKLEP